MACSVYFDLWHIFLPKFHLMPPEAIRRPIAFLNIWRCTEIGHKWNFVITHQHLVLYMACSLGSFSDLNGLEHFNYYFMKKSIALVIRIKRVVFRLSWKFMLFFNSYWADVTSMYPLSHQKPFLYIFRVSVYKFSFALL